MSQSAVDSVIFSQKSALASISALTNITLNNLDKLVSHHLSSARDTLHARFEHGKNALDAKDPQQLFSVSTSFVQPQIEQAISYFRGLYDISSSSQEEYIKKFENDHAEWNKSISSLLDWYSTSSGGSNLAIAAVKSALSAANSAIENANQTVRQVSSITEASVSAATSATSRAVDSTLPSRKKAA